MNNNKDLFRGLGVLITLNDPSDFLKVKETLTRIGVASRKEKKLFQSCHILHKQGLYSIIHFKEMFALDNKQTSISEEDIGRRNTIANLLEEWNLIKIVNPRAIEKPRAPLSLIKILSFSEKDNWVLESKYNVGNKK